MEYPINLYQIETTDGLEWTAEFPDVPGAFGGGKTSEEALADANANLKVHLEMMKKFGDPIPEPTDVSINSYSGKLAFRTTKSTHKNLAMMAEKEGVSINAYLNEAVVEKLQKDRFENIFDKMMDSFNRNTSRFIDFQNTIINQQKKNNYVQVKLTGTYNGIIGGQCNA
ncbi:MAG: type II toxin-antitoxin system HicB family antitoxin [Anaerorhabdus sp.]|uniref:type II toxin-antitoxin system HicB family antitoxin n=1 Tax=Anaerorhabdus sp. TaxID=1872524 RepID=UPI003A8679CA